MNVIPQRVKDGFVRLIGPLARLLISSGVHPNTITTVGTLVVVGSGVAFATGAIRLGGLLLLISGILDLLDGQVARQGGKMTTFGAFYDSTLDRIGEGAVFAGLIFYFLTGPLPADMKPRAIAAGLVALVASFLVSYTRARAEALGVENKVGIAPRAERILFLGVPALLLGAGPGRPGVVLLWIVGVLALVASLLVSYTRARAESLGVDNKVGIAPRAERILLLGVPALVLGAGPGRPGVVLFWIVAVLAFVSAITVIQRVVHVARVARGAPPPSPVPKRETLPGMAAARRKGH